MMPFVHSFLVQGALFPQVLERGGGASVWKGFRCTPYTITRIIQQSGVLKEVHLQEDSWRVTSLGRKYFPNRFNHVVVACPRKGDMRLVIPDMDLVVIGPRWLYEAEA